MNYYNEWDKQLAEWLRNLIEAKLLPEGDVDDRSITEVKGTDLAGYTQCHFFAGIGGWPLALELAGWPTTRPVWTGSCPCQPFSNAGTQGGTDDPRHLWPQFQRLINECNPSVVFGEQVASKAGRAWLSGVRTDLEELGYGVGGADLCGASIGSPHIRQRLYWVGHSPSERLSVSGREQATVGEPGSQSQSQRSGESPVRLADTAGGGFGEAREPSELRTGGPVEPSGSEGIPRQATDEEVSQWGRTVNPTDGGVADPEFNAERPAQRAGQQQYADGQQDDRNPVRDDLGNRISSATPWDGAVWLQCLDNRERRIEPRIRPLADGVPGRVVKLRAYGNAIIPQVGAEFVTAFMEIEEGRLQ